MVKVGIIFDTSSEGISNITTKISEYVDDPNTIFLISDEHPVIARYLNKIQYRKCIVYHVGDTPKHKIGKYTNKGGYLSYAEIYASIKDESDVILTS